MRTIWCALLRVARTNPIFVQSSIRIGIGACLKELKRYSVYLKRMASVGLSGFGVVRPGQLWANPRNRFSRGCVTGMAISHNLTRLMSLVCSGFPMRFCRESIRSTRYRGWAWVQELCRKVRRIQLESGCAAPFIRLSGPELATYRAWDCLLFPYRVRLTP